MSQSYRIQRNLHERVIGHAEFVRCSRFGRGLLPCQLPPYPSQLRREFCCQY